MTALTERVARLRERRTDLDAHTVIIKEARLAKALTEPLRDARAYLAETMEATSPNYTAGSVEQANRVKNHVESALQNNGVPREFELQGSVTNNTHIRNYSDVDLLTVTTEFRYLKPPGQSAGSWPGDPIAYLRRMRGVAADALDSGFPEATVDRSGSKALSISGGSLRRKVDVVLAAWVETETYQSTRSRQDCGVRVLDNAASTTVENFPFLHNHQLNKKDGGTRGDLKRLIRGMKGIREDVRPKPAVTSYDIASLCWNIPFDLYLAAASEPCNLFACFLLYCDSLKNDQAKRDRLRVPNDTRPLFCDNGLKLASLLDLVAEVRDLLVQANYFNEARTLGTILNAPLRF